MLKATQGRLIRRLVGIGVVIGAAGPASAQFTSLQRELFRNLEFVTNRNFATFPEGGPLFNFNIFDQAIRYDRVADGWTFEQFRFFGTDTFNDPETVALGPLSVIIGQDPALLQNSQPVGIHNSVGFSRRLIPEAFFEVQTGQRIFNTISGQSNFVPVPLNYTVTFNTGIQDVQWTGNILIDARGNVNAMGFYDLDVRIANNGNFVSDGLFVHDEQVTDFDTGPIDVSGHVLFDGLASLLQSLGFTAEAAFPRAISSASGDLSKDKRVDELLARLEAGDQLTDEEMQFLLNEMVTAAILNDPLGFLQNGLPEEVPGFEGLSLRLSEDQPDPGTAVVPEPGTLLLVAMLIGGATTARTLTGRRMRRSWR